MKRVSTFLVYAAAAALFQISTAPNAFADSILGANLATFAVLGASGVSSDPPSTIGGNLGAPGAVTGGYIFTAGGLQQNTQIAQDAQIDLDAAILAVNNIIGVTPDFTIANGDLDQFQADHGGVISPGTYRVGAKSGPDGNLAGTLILDGGGDLNAHWYFNFTSTLITAEGSDVVVQGVGGGGGVGIYWTVDSAATLNGDTFAGNVFANQLISSNGGLTMSCGRLASAEAAVTLIGDKISIGCEGTGADSGGFDDGVEIGSGGTGGSNGQVVIAPEPATLLLWGTGIAALVVGKRRSARGTQRELAAKA